MLTDTIKIKYPEPFGYAFIAKTDFDPEIHELFEEEKSVTVAEKNPTPKRRNKAEEAEVQE